MNAEEHDSSSERDAPSPAPSSTPSSAGAVQAPPALPADCPFSPRDLAACEQTLALLMSRPDILESAALRPLRKTLTPLVDAAMTKRYRGEDLSTHKSGRDKTAERHRKQQQQKAHDRALLDKRVLRLERIKQVEAMALAMPGVPMIPDGAVFDGVNIALGQTSGTSQVPSVQNSLSAGQFSSSQRLTDKPVEEEGVARLPQQLQPLQQRLQQQQEEEELHNPRSCYVCKCRFYRLHHFYDQLCPNCSDLNWTKRMQSVNLAGKVAVLTGGRVKVGYQIALKLLRAGATCVITSRFPADACERFSREPDFGAWKLRLRMFGIDLRDIVAVELLCTELARKLPRLDILVNNACQTVRRPPAYYAHLLGNEEACLRDGRFAPLLMEGSAHGMTQRPLLLVGPSGHGSAAALASRDVPMATAAQLSQVPVLHDDATHDSALFPDQMFDVNAQQVDLREHTSWTTRLDQVHTPEAVEVLAVNTLTPLIFNARLKGLFLRTRQMDLEANVPDVGRYIVNVSSMEGKFGRVKDVVQYVRLRVCVHAHPRQPTLEHGQGRAQHDDQDERAGLRQGRDLHDERGHGVALQRSARTHRGEDCRHALPDAHRRGGRREPRAGPRVLRHDGLGPVAAFVRGVSEGLLCQ
jgi:NAD(P)-dependent dehydrogenase (short-subunit alcohol dehydrogenase family)